jgi:tetrahydromethanopterin S-methyltransferase subunit G
MEEIISKLEDIADKIPFTTGEIFFLQGDQLRRSTL